MCIVVLLYVLAIVQYIGKPSRIMSSPVLSWSELMELGKSVTDTELDKRISNLAVNQAALLVYTSGTTGNPKGVLFNNNMVHGQW